MGQHRKWCVHTVKSREQKQNLQATVTPPHMNAIQSTPAPVIIHKQIKRSKAPPGSVNMYANGAQSSCPSDDCQLDSCSPDVCKLFDGLSADLCPTAKLQHEFPFLFMCLPACVCMHLA